MSHTVSIAREIACDALVQVLEHGRDPDLIVDELCAAQGKPVRRLDRNFIKEVLFGTLRWYSKMLWILQNTASRNLNEVTPEIRAALLTGTYQIFYMDRVPDRAAVNESVEYIRAKGQANAVGFINGILRQISRRAEYFAKPDKVKEPVKYLSLQFAHPEWIVSRWAEHFRFDKMEKMLAANNQPPPCTVRANLLKVPLDDVHLLAQRLLKEERTHTDRRPLRSALVLRDAPNLDPASMFGQGLYTIQDEAAQLVGLLVSPQPGEFIVDGNCAPGGKLSHIYELAGGNIRLTGIDKSPTRMPLARETIQRLGHADIELLQVDFLEYKPAQAPDKILLDAPCSGLGVLRRHPEGKWLKDAGLIKAMAEQQRNLISHAISVVKPGGEVIYSVCSFEPEETTGHLQWIEEKYGDRIELLSPVPRLPDYYKKYVTRENVMLIYAGNQDNMDGFGAFIIKVVR